MNASSDFAAARIASVQVGPIAPLGPRVVPSGIVKRPVAAAVAVGPLGLDGDMQADLSCHGGHDKAVYGYASSHYPSWRGDFPALTFGSGSMGENLTIDGLDETVVHIGDIVGHGGTVLQVTQPRAPCFKLALAFAEPKIVRAMTRSGRSGWYYRVVEPGNVAAGDTLMLLERPNPGWTVARFNAAVLSRNVDPALAQLAGLADYWRDRLSPPR